MLAAPHDISSPFPGLGETEKLLRLSQGENNRRMAGAEDLGFISRREGLENALYPPGMDAILRLLDQVDPPGLFQVGYQGQGEETRVPSETIQEGALRPVSYTTRRYRCLSSGRSTVSIV